MADFWIKVEKGTPDKPEVLEMSAILNIDDPDTVLGKLVRVWAWFDSNSENGHAPSVTKVLLDRLTGVTGFVDAMTQVGWLNVSEDGFEITNFDRHLGKGAKKRASDAERKRKSRETSGKCHKESVTENGLEKSREEKIIKDTSGKPNLCPHQEIIDAYHEKLPSLPRVKVWNDKRQTALRTRWNEDKDRQDVDYWRNLFDYISQSDFLMGRANDFRADLEWIITSANFVKIIEGRYENQR
jgi:hypothetical protein